MRPEFPALAKAIKLVRRLFDFGLMIKFANLMDGNRLLNSKGLEPLNEKFEAARKAIEEADKEGLITSQQANELTQRFYLEKLEDFHKILVFQEYSEDFLRDTVNGFNEQFPDKKVNFDSLVIYKLYMNGLVADINRICSFYRDHLEKILGTPHLQLASYDKSHVMNQKEKETNLPTISGRLKVSLNTDRLAVLMRLLYDCNVINSSKGEIHAFVADHIQTVGMQNKRISAANFGKKFSSKNSDISNYLIAKLEKMIQLAKKR